MSINTFLRERKSTRTFKEKALNSDVVSSILNAMSEFDQCETVEFKLLEDGDRVYKALDGKAGYAGIMIKAPAYLAVNYKDESKYGKIHGAYKIEELITKLVKLGLSTCWITVSYLDEATKNEIEVNEHTDYIIALGESAESTILNSAPTSSRRDVTKLVFMGDFDTPADPDELANLGLLDLFSSARYAPSHMNRQPWRFLVGKKKVELYIKNDKHVNTSLTDAGIIMYYYDGLLKAMGGTGEWDISVDDSENIDGYIKVGEHNL
ncbi:MAG: nitroreductase family protein [Tissierellia bacterium]|nr:nitroreductase family protein [Tissierellia bacterium]